MVPMQQYGAITMRDQRGFDLMALKKKNGFRTVKSEPWEIISLSEIPHTLVLFISNIHFRHNPLCIYAYCPM